MAQHQRNKKESTKYICNNNEVNPAKTTLLFINSKLQRPSSPFSGLCALLFAVCETKRIAFDNKLIKTA